MLFCERAKFWLKITQKRLLSELDLGLTILAIAEVIWTPRISGLETNIFESKMMVKSGLEVFILEFY